MTTTETRTFNPYDVPATGSADVSRFPVGVSPAGHTGPPDQVYANLLSNLVADRQNEQPQIIPETVVVELFKVVRSDKTGEYALVQRPGVRAVPTRANTRPGRFGTVKAQGIELLNDAFLGGEAWEKARDADIWEALLAACKDVQAQGRALRMLCDLTALLILARAGIVTTADRLAWE